MIKDYESVIALDIKGVGEGQKLGVEALSDFFARTSRFAVAFSGGTDSAYLLAAAVEAGCEVKAYMVNTQFQPAFELEDAREIVVLTGVPFEILNADVLTQTDICENQPNRCYLCKKFIFGTIWQAAKRDGFEVLVDGTNASDDPARRPGFKALSEMNIVSPLRRAGMTKAQVREASARLNLPTAQKPRFACLAVHVPEGEVITEESLKEVACSHII